MGAWLRLGHLGILSLEPEPSNQGADAGLCWVDLSLALVTEYCLEAWFPRLGFMNLLAYKTYCFYKAVQAGCLSRAIEKDLQHTQGLWQNEEGALLSFFLLLKYIHRRHPLSQTGNGGMRRYRLCWHSGRLGPIGKNRHSTIANNQYISSFSKKKQWIIRGLVCGEGATKFPLGWLTWRGLGVSIILMGQGLFCHFNPW